MAGKAILDEEFEVLDSIFPDETERTSDTSLSIRIEPEEPNSAHPLTLNLVLTYPPTYPDAIPEIALESISEAEGEFTESERAKVLAELTTIAEESIGMAMSFTLASAAREALVVVIDERIKWEKEEDDRKTREYEEAEAARTRGTPLTPSAFQSWRLAFCRELADKRQKAEEARIRALPPREREDYKKRQARLTGKQLFESGNKAAVVEDDNLYEEGVEEIDLRKYTREEREEERRKEEEEEERRRRGLVEGDSDGE
ncbi:hypothetical protein L202_08442 [Cryptococcus amylolentus CBS 6039]|uniref:RWD domain-containing protein n=1 Tax=Cryptococcus amylolentus CBS 6039 TaxID=1295533 RepID=A0A1E3H9N4_9TREE|nr:hypothetical protein L202_08442 [Cryptococcus amylolentus CBS 6039]ODN73047.1 hypothetical protein L202_08442 [Cryptococcus amylolentus CBS 6039]